MNCPECGAVMIKAQDGPFIERHMIFYCGCGVGLIWRISPFLPNDPWLDQFIAVNLDWFIDRDDLTCWTFDPDVDERAVVEDLPIPRGVRHSDVVIAESGDADADERAVIEEGAILRINRQKRSGQAN